MKKTKKSFEWNKVTPLSKYLTMALFVALPFMGFILGMKYQQQVGQVVQYVSMQSGPKTQAGVQGGLKTYANSEYGFQLKYPTHWIVTREAQEFGESTGIGTPESANTFVKDGGISITVIDIGTKTINDYMNEENPSTGGLNKQTYQFQKNITIGGKKGIVTFGGCCGGWGHQVFVKNGNYLYKFSVAESMDDTVSKIEDLPLFYKTVTSVQFKN